MLPPAAARDASDAIPSCLSRRLLLLSELLPPWKPPAAAAAVLPKVHGISVGYYEINISDYPMLPWYYVIILAVVLLVWYYLCLFYAWYIFH